MASTEIDINKLLVLVQARPPLYNMSIKDYHNKDVIEKLWEEIGQELNTTGKIISIPHINLLLLCFFTKYVLWYHIIVLWKESIIF